VQALRDRKNGLGPEEVRRRAWERRRTADYAELVEGLELFCEDWVTRDLDGNPKHLDAEGLEREQVHLKKYWFPDDEAAHARVDCFFDSWRYPDAEAVAGASAVDFGQDEEPDSHTARTNSWGPVSRTPAGVLGFRSLRKEFLGSLGPREGTA
jgi:hypothetical protein